MKLSATDGCAIYIGRANVLLKGRYAGVVAFQNLAKLVEEHQFWDLQDQYAMNRVDSPGMKMRVAKPGKTKTVETRNTSEVPLDFYALSKIIDGFVFTTYWVSHYPKERARGPSPGPFRLPSEVVPGCS